MFVTTTTAVPTKEGGLGLPHELHKSTPHLPCDSTSKSVPTSADDASLASVGNNSGSPTDDPKAKTLTDHNPADGKATKATLTVYTPQYRSVMEVPKSRITHMPPPHITRYVLCETPDCALGSRCKFVHADVTGIPEHPLHVNYAWRSLDECEYDRLEKGRTFKVSAPNCDRTGKSEMIPSESLLKTKIKPNGHIVRCTHFHYLRVCNRGADCNFAHVVHIDPKAKLYQRAPPFSAKPPVVTATAEQRPPRPPSETVCASCSLRTCSASSIASDGDTPEADPPQPGPDVNPHPQQQHACVPIHPHPQPPVQPAHPQSQAQSQSHAFPAVHAPPSVPQLADPLQRTVVLPAPGYPHAFASPHYPDPPSCARFLAHAVPSDAHPKHPHTPLSTTLYQPIPSQPSSQVVTAADGQPYVMQPLFPVEQQPLSANAAPQPQPQPGPLPVHLSQPPHQAVYPHRLRPQVPTYEIQQPQQHFPQQPQNYPYYTSVQNANPQSQQRFPQSQPVDVPVTPSGYMQQQSHSPLVLFPLR